MIDEENRIGLGHNLLSIFKQINENNEIIDNIEDNIQPIILNDLVLVFNGEIYNFNKLETFLKECNEDYQESKSDSRLLANILNYYFSLHDGNECLDDSLVLLESVKSAVRDLDGDYSFAVYDRKYSNIAIARDQIEIHDLSPGSILYNWEMVDLEDNLINKIINADFNDLKGHYKEYKDYLDTKDSYEYFKELLVDGLYSAVEKRVENLTDIGLIFSGGVDSTILAVLLKKIAEKRNDENRLPLNVRLYSVGVENSPDIRFSKEMAEDMNLPLKTIMIDEQTVKESVKPVLTAIEDDNIMKLGVGMTIYLASKAMKDDNVKVALSGQGADELFGGYNRYLKHFEENSLFDAYFALDEEIYHDIANMHHVNLERDDAVSMANGVELRVPFLDKDIIDLALDIPGKYKIKDGEDVLRKHILRDVAKSIGVPDYIADRPKKAAQYGSGINKILKKRVLRSFDIEEFVDSLKHD